jgi:DNA-directed RNA polymerase subunit M/transcription elongation factor TFIIS
MNFCEKCGFMYYITTTEEDTLMYYCRNCGHENKELSVEELKVTVYEKSNNTQKQINPWIKFDPTLPRTNTIKCPNEKCKSNEKDQTPDIIYIRYNDIDMKYMYICTKCDFNWKP